MQGNRWIYKIFSSIVVAAILLSSLPSSHRNALGAYSQDNHAQSTGVLALPAPIPGNPPTATILVNPSSGYITQAVTVSGETSATATQVRMAWIYGDGTQTVSAAVMPTAATATAPKLAYRLMLYLDQHRFAPP